MFETMQERFRSEHNEDVHVRAAYPSGAFVKALRVDGRPSVAVDGVFLSGGGAVRAARFLLETQTREDVPLDPTLRAALEAAVRILRLAAVEEGLTRLDKTSEALLAIGAAKDMAETVID